MTNVLTKNDGIEEVDHPSFKDEVYMKRRQEIAEVALEYKITNPVIPKINYTNEDRSVWKFCYPRLRELYDTHASREFLTIFRNFEKDLGYNANQIP